MSKLRFKKKVLNNTSTNTPNNDFLIYYTDKLTSLRDLYILP